MEVLLKNEFQFISMLKMCIVCHSSVCRLTEMISIIGLAHPVQELICQLLIVGPSHSPLHWLCWLPRQPSFIDCTLTPYWILLLPTQHMSSNHILIQ